MEFIKNHYSDTRLRRSPEQAEKEKYILGLRFSRWLMFPAAFIFQAICGSLYAWSVWNDPIDGAIYGTAPNAKGDQIPVKHNAAITFYIAVGCFGLSAAINGPWLERVGPRKAALVGTTLFFLGNMIASIGIHFQQIAVIYFGYGVVGGAGLGLSYISPVSALQKWFPDRRGIAGGFAVCGFGAGSIALAKAPGALFKVMNLTNTFITLGCCYFAVMVLCCLVFRTPPPGFVVNGLDVYRNRVENNGDVEAFKNESSAATVDNLASRITLTESIFSRDYMLIYIMFFGNSIAGLVFLSRLANVVKDIFGKDADTAATIVSINGGFNLFGRLFFAAASDKLGRKNAYIVMLGTQVAILASLPTVMESRNYPAFLALIWILASCYGGGFGSIPAFLCDMFGPTNIGALHGIILTAWAIAGVGGGLLFTFIYNELLANGYTVKDVWIYAKNFYWILAVASVGFLIILLVRTSIRDRLFPAIPGQFTRIRIFGRLFRVGSFGFQSVSKEQEDAEWSAFVESYNRSRASPDTLQEVGYTGGDKMELDHNELKH